MSELEKAFLKKSDKKTKETENQCQNAASGNKKPLARNANSILTKNRPRMNYDWIGKTIFKKSDPKNRKKLKNQSEVAACEQKTTREKGNFCSGTVFLLYLKIRAKNFTPQNHPLFFAPFLVSA